jgi:hypothetical protein
VPFKKGQSGNPSGRRPGSRNKATELIEKLLESEAEALGRKAVELALAGNPVMLKMCLERIAPADKSRRITFKLPPISSVSDLAGAQGSILSAMSEGAISPEDALAAARIVDATGAALERIDLEARLAALEDKANADQNRAPKEPPEDPRRSERLARATAVSEKMTAEFRGKPKEDSNEGPVEQAPPHARAEAVGE